MTHAARQLAATTRCVEALERHRSDEQLQCRQPDICVTYLLKHLFHEVPHSRADHVAGKLRGVVQNDHVSCEGRVGEASASKGEWGETSRARRGLIGGRG